MGVINDMIAVKDDHLQAVSGQQTKMRQLHNAGDVQIIGWIHWLRNESRSIVRRAVGSGITGLRRTIKINGIGEKLDYRIGRVQGQEERISLGRTVKGIRIPRRTVPNTGWEQELVGKAVVDILLHHHWNTSAVVGLI